jgi:hypothetical protein
MEFGPKFLSSKRSTVEAAAEQAEMLALLLRSRLNAKLQPGEGSEIIGLAQKSLNCMIEAQECGQQAHALLAPYRRSWNIPSMTYGEEDTPPSHGMTSKLELVDVERAA